eukprot:GEMP01051915.1.p1 GENE.GEMP01051915.1~~GEMP01051915.1.p1  ORF type:complete len:125 (+),score=7.15 GEMP01051915.1:1142-1516(+)
MLAGEWVRSVTMDLSVNIYIFDFYCSETMAARVLQIMVCRKTCTCVPKYFFPQEGSVNDRAYSILSRATECVHACRNMFFLVIAKKNDSHVYSTQLIARPPVCAVDVRADIFLFLVWVTMLACI